MSLFVDTSVWSLAYRRDAPPQSAEVRALRQALANGDDIAVTGIVLLELLRGFVPPGAQRTIKEAFAVLEFVEPSRQDYIDAAAISTTCRRKWRTVRHSRRLDRADLRKQRPHSPDNGP